MFTTISYNLSISLIFFNRFYINNIKVIKLYKKYAYFLKKKKSFIINFLYLNVVKSKSSNARVWSNGNNLLDYKKKLFSLVIDNRKIFNLIMLDNSISKIISKTILILSKLNSKRQVNTFNNQVWLVLLKSGLVTSKNDFHFLLSFNLIYLNFNTLKKPCTLVSGDFLSICFNKHYFKYLLFRLTNIQLFIKKFKKKYINLGNLFFKDFIKIKELKKNKTKALKYLFLFKNFKVDNVEVDFSILSIYIINLYMSVGLSYILWKRVISTYLFKLYNWKYIN